MSLLITFFIMTTLLTTLLSIMGQMLPTHLTDIQKVSPYECGFDPMKSPRLPFSFRFFLVAMLFLIFDLEIALLLPLPFTLLLTNTTKSLLPLTSFLLMLAMGLYYEWVMGGLEWADN